METQQLRASTGNVTVTAEVSVNLPGKCVGSDKNDPQIWRTKPACESRICQHSTIVRYDALPYEPRKNQQKAIEESIGIEHTLSLNLGKQMTWSLNRTCN